MQGCYGVFTPQAGPKIILPRLLAVKWSEDG